MPDLVHVSRLVLECRDELERATSLHAPMHSAHEGYAVILEELDELKEEVWLKTSMRDVSRMRAEAIQIAAMALRFVLDVCDAKAEGKS